MGRDSVTRLIFLSIFTSFVALQMAAQQPAAREIIEVRLLELDVVVTDKDGNPVQGLTPSDLELFEDGRRQEITNLSEYVDTQTDRINKPSTAPSTASGASRLQPRRLLVMLDTLPLRGGARKELFDSLRLLVQKTLREGDRANIVEWVPSGFRTTLEETTDVAAIQAALTSIEDRPTATAGGLSVEEQEALLRDPQDDKAELERQLATARRHRAEGELAEMRRKTASMQRIVSSLTGTAAKTVIVYVSERFPRIAGLSAFTGQRSAGGAPSPGELAYDTSPMIEAVVRSANANGVSFYALRPRIPSTAGDPRSIAEDQAVYDNVTGGTEAIADHMRWQNELQALAHLAEQTGGTVGAGPQGVRDAIDQISRDMGSYYSIGWRTRSDGSDRERHVRVTAKNRAYKVRTRVSLVEKSDRTRATDLLIAHLFERGSSGDLEFEVSAGAPHTVRSAMTIATVDLTIPVDQLKFAPEGDELAARFTVFTVAGPHIGQTTKVTSDTRRLVAPQGEPAEGVARYKFDLVADLKPTTVAVGVYDENSGLLGIRTIELKGGRASVALPDFSDPVAAAAWREATARAERERKPLLVFFRPRRCRPCEAFEKESMTHPAIVRRLGQVVFAKLPMAANEITSLWPSKDPGLALFDADKNLRAHWIGIPDTTTLGVILDTTIVAAPDFERALQLAGTDPYESQRQIAVGLTKLGRTAEARTVVEEIIASAAPETKQRAMIVRAYLDVREGKAAEALADLEALLLDPRTATVAEEATTAIATIKLVRGSSSGTSADGSVVRIAPFDQQIVTGKKTVRTIVTSPAVARVAFTVGGKEVATVTRPPFSTTVAFAAIPEPTHLRAVAFDSDGTEIGRDEITVNDGGEVFWLRLATPSPGPASGDVPVEMNLRTPPAEKIDRVTVTWNEKEVAVLKSPPWRTVVNIPAGQLGVLHAVAELDNGRRAEDAVPLNTTGYVERAEVQIVELPVAITRSDAPIEHLAANDVSVSEGRKSRTIESVTLGAESRLTVGILLDTSASMQKTLPDVQEAAVRFLDSVLDPDDRAFVVTFNTRATLLQPPTSDKSLLRQKIMARVPNGLTALHDAMILGLLQFEGVKGRRALVVFTDSGDRTSRYKLDDVRRLARRSNVPIYLITPPQTMAPLAALPIETGRRRTLPGTPQIPGTSRAMLNLLDVARSSGGELHEIRRLDALPEVYAAIARSLRAQVLVNIRTEPAATENEWREINVKVAGRGVEVRAPSGYYAPQ